MIFSKEHLSGNYNWAAGPGDSFLIGSPSRRLFDRWNGVQVLFMINSIAALSETFSLDEARKVESLIHDQLPLDSRSEISVFNWLRHEAPKD
jgi:hypothetical protein